MEWLNYQHFFYFWVVAKHGSIASAAKELRLAHPTISEQIHRLEEVLGVHLFEHRRQRLLLTDEGRIALGYAAEIFTQGQEFMDTIHGRPSERPIRLDVGISAALPMGIARRMLEPAFALGRRVQVVCREARSSDAFLKDLATRALDVVLSDAPVAGSDVPLVNHLLGECGTAFLGDKGLAAKLRRGFPRALGGAPFVLPGRNAALRRCLEQWFEDQHVRPVIVAEVEDSSFVTELGEGGLGVVAVPDLAEDVLGTRSKASLVGRAPELRQQFYAISVERKLKHPAVLAICDTARKKIFAEPS